MIQLVANTIDAFDIDALCNWLKVSNKLTKGPITELFEKEWSNFIGVKYSTFVNSGSSANLLMLSVLIELGILKKEDYVVVPAVCWATDFSPVVSLNLNPLICDCNLEDLSIDIDHLKDLIKWDKSKVLLLVSVLGLVPNLDEIIKVCEDNDMILLCDDCESLGSQYKGRKLGNFGLMSSFSLYFGHHLNTIEGGMICTNDENLNDVLKSMRSHGWDRDLSSDKQKQLREKHSIDEFDALYTFYNLGYNMRSTDLQAFIGRRQLVKAHNIVNIRNENFFHYHDSLNSGIWKPKIYEDRYISNFAYPIIHENRKEIVKNLKKEDIEARPLIAGNITRHPVYSKYGDPISLKNADKVHDFGMYLPNHHELTKEQILHICDIVNSSI